MTSFTGAGDAHSWRALLEQRVAKPLAHDIATFEGQMAQKRAGRLSDEVFAEIRLRRGVYGQRYDNGQRHDGQALRAVEYPDAQASKGPMTRWHAPGMQRIKLPFGALTATQLEVIADLAEEYADGILHVTTRQDIQLHFVHIDDTPDLMWRLGAVNVTTQEACGNAVRNVTACPLAGVCHTEAFDVTPHAHATAQFLLGHPDAQEFGRKFKIAFSGCADEACGLAMMHDIGAVARIRNLDGAPRRGFALYVGGGLGAVPHQAQLLDEFVPETELLPLCQAICRVFARLGEKKNRARARLKFLVAKLGLEAFRRLVLAERAILPADPRWTAHLDDRWEADRPVSPPRAFGPAADEDAFEAWRRTNVAPQRQDGYHVVTVTLPLGDITADQARALAALARDVGGDTLRTTVEQNLVYRWVRDEDLRAFYGRLAAVGLADGGAGTVVDVTACPGTDTCKLGIASSRGLARELRLRLASAAIAREEAIRGLRIKVSGCFNSCGQHHAADIGFWGVSRKHDGRTVPHFQVVLGGEWGHNVASYGLAVTAVPSKRVPEVVERLAHAYLSERQPGESFQACFRRMGKSAIRTLLEDLTVVPPRATAPDLYTDWGDPREFSIGDMGVGECAGQVVSPVDFGLQAAERELFAAQDRLDKDDPTGGASIAYRAMLLAARALARGREPGVGEDPDEVVAAFQTALVEEPTLRDAFGGSRFAGPLLRAHREERDGTGQSLTAARRRIEEAQLFLEAAHTATLRADAGVGV